MPFVKGQAKTPGSGKKRGHACGRKKALGVLDEVAGRDANLQRLRDKLNEAFRDDALKAWRDFIQPNLPKEMQIEHKGATPTDQYAEILLELIQERREERLARPQSDS